MVSKKKRQPRQKKRPKCSNRFDFFFLEIKKSLFIFTFGQLFLSYLSFFVYYRKYLYLFLSIFSNNSLFTFFKKHKNI